jgi:hypothetical protein
MVKSIPLAAALGVVGLLAAACGGPSGTSGTPGGSTGSLDNCLIGNWTSSGVSGQVSNGTVSGSLSGGTGEKVKIQPNGALSINDAVAQPILVALVDGSTITLQRSGSGTGKLSTVDPQLTVTLDSGGTLVTTQFGADGKQNGTPAPAAGFTATYMCTPGHSFSFTYNGETFEFQPG